MPSITVEYIASSHSLGTEDGISYHIYPELPDDDEVGLHGKDTTNE